MPTAVSFDRSSAVAGDFGPNPEAYRKGRYFDGLAAGISLWSAIGHLLLTHLSGPQPVSCRLFNFMQL